MTYVSVAVQNQLVYAGMVEIDILAQQFRAVCALKADVAAQHSAIHQEQFSAALEQVTSVIHNMVAMVAVLFVTTVQEQDHAVLKPMAEISTSEADSVAPRSLPAIQTALVQLTIMWQFLQDYLPAMAVWLSTELKQITDSLTGQEWDSINSSIH
jgi:hypothetical protein